MAHKGLFPSQAVAEQSKGRMAFLLVLVCYAIIDFGRLRWVPFGIDSNDYWHNFYGSYAELLHNNDLAHWFPYGFFGQPNTAYNLMRLTSTDYLMMVIGKVFQIKNAVLLFQLSLMADHLLFLFGIHLLSRSIVHRRSANWLCLIGSITVLYGFQLNFLQVFRMVAWYPLILYFLVWFFRDQRAEGLWLAGIVFVFSCLGNAYQQPYVVMAVLPFMAVGTWKHSKAWRGALCWRTSNLVAMLLFAAVVSLYLYLALHILDGMEILRQGRVSSGSVSVETFLGERDCTVFELLISFIGGHRHYIGLLPLGCVMWGIFHVRTPTFGAFMASALLLVWFSLGGLYSVSLYYYAPFFSQIHFLYMGFHLIPVLLLVAAGVAWDQFVPRKQNYKTALVFALILFFTIDLCLYGDQFILTPTNLRVFFNSVQLTFIKLAVYAGVLLLPLMFHLLRSVRRSPNERWVGTSFRPLVTAALLLGLLIDVFQYSYQSGSPVNELRETYRDPPVRSWLPVDRSSPDYKACYVQPLTWQGERLDEPIEERQHVILQSPAYSFHTYAFAQFDPCWPKLAPGSIGSAMQKLLALRDKNIPALDSLLGCHAPKLRLLTQVLYVNDEAEATVAIRNGGDLTRTVIVQWPVGAPQPPVSRSSSAESAGSIRVTDFGANDIEIHALVTAPEGAWLVYADTYDPRWRGWVNGKSVPIVPAYLGLKAVWVPHGESIVRMKFSAWSNVGMRILAVGGALCSLLLLLSCGICCFRGFPPSSKCNLAGHISPLRPRAETSD